MDQLLERNWTVPGQREASKSLQRGAASEEPPAEPPRAAWWLRAGAERLCATARTRHALENAPAELCPWWHTWPELLGVAAGLPGRGREQYPSYRAAGSAACQGIMD